jgi:hypothetical protein
MSPTSPAGEACTALYVRAQAAWIVVRQRLRTGLAGDDRGEGVISAAIAVLIMAFLGALMWAGFKAMWDATEDKTNEQIEQIGG